MRFTYNVHKLLRIYKSTHTRARLLLDRLILITRRLRGTGRAFIDISKLSCQSNLTKVVALEISMVARDRVSRMFERTRGCRPRKFSLGFSANREYPTRHLDHPADD